MQIEEVRGELPMLEQNFQSVYEKFKLQFFRRLFSQVREREAALAGEGRILLRPSGTEALIRVMVEAKTVELAHEVATDLADFIKKL